MSRLARWIVTRRQRRVAQQTATNVKSTACRTRLRTDRLEDRTLPAVFFVSSLADSGTGSLRQAILDANAHANTVADPIDTIRFSVAGTISVASPLDALSDPTGGTVIDGRTTPGFGSAPVVVLRGPGAGSNVTGLTITTANNAVWGLQIDSFATGIDVKGAGATGNVIAGNYIGTDGTAALSNSTGVLVESGASSNVIGGTTGDARNVISGNGTGVGFGPFNTQNNIVEGNYIGTNATGTAAVGNTTYGVYFNFVSNNKVGGTAPGAANVISGNAAGVHLDFGSSGEQIIGNLIGTQANGTGALGNTGNGVEIFLASTTCVSGNTVAFNGGNGVFVSGGSATGTLIRSNSIFSNARLGIDLFSGSDPANGVTPNDAGDGDSGPNNLQNYPVLNAASSSVSGGTFVTGTLNGTANASFTLEFFASTAGDSSGFGEGAAPLGQVTVTTDGGGSASFAATFAAFVPAGQVITATATSAGNDTSEFSHWIAVVADPTVSVSNATVTESDTGTVTAVFTISLSGAGVRPLTVNFATADGTATAAAGLGGTDYQPSNGTLTFAAGETSKTLEVIVNGDRIDEDDETFYVFLSDVMNGTIGGGQGIGTILDNDPPPSASVNDVQVKEGDTGFISATFTVTLSAASARQVEISYTTANGTAVAPDDYTTTSGVLTFAPGQVTATVSVPVRGDLLHEGDETFTLNLSSPVKATITDAQGVGTIIDDDTPPVAANDAATTDEDTPVTVNVLANDTDADGDKLTVTGNTPGANGSVVVNADNSVTYTPAPNFNGTDSFTYTVNDGRGFSATATVTVTVNPVNDAPVARDDSPTTDEDTPATVNVLANDSDVDGDSLTVTSATQGAHGSVVVNQDGTLTYSPAADFNGSDSFTYSISDGHGGTATATVTVIVNPVNDAPVAKDDSATTDEDTPVTASVLANDTDVDGDSLTVTVVGQAAHGGVVINSDGTVTYTSAANYNGADSFTYTVDDGHGGTATASVSILINPVNDAPAAVADSATVDEDASATVNVLANDGDVDGDALTITAVTQGAHGSVVLNADGTVTYAPAADFNGGDSFSYTINDGNGGTATATVTIVVNPVNDAPAARDDAATTDEDTSINIPVLANDTDVDGDALVVSGFTQGAHGSVGISADGIVTYTPEPNYNGADSFTYSVDDGHGGTATASVSVVINAVNDAPVAQNDSPTLDEDTSATVNVLANDGDADGDAITITGVTQGGHGAVVLNGDGSVTYTPAPNFNGNDQFTYSISDGHGATATGTVSVTVTPVNDAPVAADDSAVTDEDTEVTFGVLGNDTDVDGDTLSVTGVTQGAHGVVVLNSDGTLTYAPAPNSNGSDSFIYTIGDGHGGAASATVTVLVNPVNDAPVANPDSASTNQDQSVTLAVLANDTDAEGDTLTVTDVTPGGHGTTTINPNGTVTYTPAAGFFGSDSFNYTVGDGHGGTATASVSVTVNAVTSGNRPPEITTGDLTLSATAVNEGGSVSLSGTFRDADAGQTHTVVITWGDGSSSTLNLAAGVTSFGPVSHTYRDDDPTGTPSDLAPISVTVTDSAGAVASADTSVRVNNVAPTVQLGPNRTVAEGSTVSLTGNFTDPGAPDRFTFHWHVAGSNGQVVADGSGQNFSFTPNDNGTYTVTFTVTDDDQGIGQGQVIVTATNVAPTAGLSGPSTGVRGQPQTFTFTATDPSSVDGQAGFSYFVNWGDGSSSTVTGQSPKSLDHVYKHKGTYTVTVTATDKDGGSGTASVVITITSMGVQQTPAASTTQSALTVGGTDGDDFIGVGRGDAPGQVVAVMVSNGSVSVASFTPTASGAHYTLTENGATAEDRTIPAAASLGRIVIYGQAGDDHIMLLGWLGQLTVPAYLFGGDGNDMLDASGSSANNVLVGGAGQDWIWGGRGRDLLIGGTGADQLRGNDGNDILIGGTTDYDGNIVALTSVVAEWGQADLSYNVRVNHLGGQSGGLNGPFVLTTRTVHADSSSDILYGLGGLDWFFARVSGYNPDAIKYQDCGEVVTRL